MASSSSLPAPDAEPYSPHPHTPTPPSIMEEAPEDHGLPPLDMPTPSTTPATPAAPVQEPAYQQPAAAEPIDYSKPVAYDQNGRPLYAHPPEQPAAPAPATMPASEPAKPEPAPKHETPKPAAPENAEEESEAVDPASSKPEAAMGNAEKHQESVDKYPKLNLSEGEYVISVIPRDPIGLLEIWGAAIIFFVALGGFVAAFLYGEPVSTQTRTIAAFGLGIVGLLDIIGASIFSKIYQGNIVYVTNESIIQLSQTSLLAQRSQTVGLGNVQNVKYSKNGYLGTLFDFGSLQLATEGEDTDYRFTHVANPKRQADIINNAVEAFAGLHGQEHLH